MVSLVVITVFVSIGHKVWTTILLAGSSWSTWHLTAPKEELVL
ncbi:hypothetical protein Javan320_0014 [Streptococcus phage Javan320]|nr:hypothetical protein Javan320_0014 [Streptococcus phage Javan320]